MEYDKSTGSAPPIPEDAPHTKNSLDSKRGHIRVESKPSNLSVLGESVTLPFSGKTAKNRFLKAPMTERLCQWNKEGEDIVSIFLLIVSGSLPLMNPNSQREAIPHPNTSTFTKSGPTERLAL